MTTKIDTKRTELDHLKKELKTFKKLIYANVPVAFEATHIQQKIKKLTAEIAELKES